MLKIFSEGVFNVEILKGFIEVFKPKGHDQPGFWKSPNSSLKLFFFVLDIFISFFFYMKIDNDWKLVTKF